MWNHYRRFAVYNQIFIVVVCVMARVVLRMSWPAVAVMFAIMQAGALVGAWWSAARERAKPHRSATETLPLERK